MTDFGYRDPYVGIMKAVILSIYPKARLIDLTHEIEPQNVVQAAYYLENAYHFFPRGSIFICVVDPGVGTDRKPLCLRTKHYFFVGPDNGIFDLIIRRERGYQARCLLNRKFFLTSERISHTFHGRDVFAPVAAHLARRHNIFPRLGSKILKLESLNIPDVKKKRDCLEGEVLYFDRFGNAITNIRYEDAQEHVWRKADVWIRGRRRVGKVRETYALSQKGPIPLFNSAWQLELAIPGGSAKDTASIQVGDSVTVRISS